MEIGPDKKIKFFGCPMDCDEKYEAIQEKRCPPGLTGGFDDPLDGVMDQLLSSGFQVDMHPGSWENLGSVPVPGWLGPKPCPEDRRKLTTENVIDFIDGNGCREIARDIGRYVTEKILPDFPCMIGIDHSLTGGIYEALARYYGKENLSLIVMDSHTDAVPMTALAGAVQYDAETNPASVHDPDDPFIYSRGDSYNASSFLNDLIQEGIVDPGNLYILGVSDFPDKKVLRIKDTRMKRYAEAYTKLKGKGVRIITKKECKLNPQKLSGVLKTISTPYVYLSIDMDIGANDALHGVRFRNWTGLDETKIYKLADQVKQVFSGSVRLAGMDICEIDPRRAGLTGPDGMDPTYAIAANLVRKLLVNG